MQRPLSGRACAMHTVQPTSAGVLLKIPLIGNLVTDGDADVVRSVAG